MFVHGYLRTSSTAGHFSLHGSLGFLRTFFRAGFFFFFFSRLISGGYRDGVAVAAGNCGRRVT